MTTSESVCLSRQAAGWLMPELCTMGHELSPGHASLIRCSVLMHRQLYNEMSPDRDRPQGDRLAVAHQVGRDGPGHAWSRIGARG